MKTSLYVKLYQENKIGVSEEELTTYLKKRIDHRKDKPCTHRELYITIYYREDIMGTIVSMGTLQCKDVHTYGILKEFVVYHSQ